MKKVALISIFLLSSFAASVSAQDAFDLLRKGDVEAVKALIEKTPTLATAKNADGQTLLHLAAYGKLPALIDFLINKGAKTEETDARFKTPLHLAAMNDRREVAAALLKRGASVAVKDDYGRTALILCARERGQAAMARLLIEAGSDMNAVDKFGDTALSLAAWRGKAELIDVLLEKGAKVPEAGERRSGMLSEAASKGLAGLFERLSAGGLDSKAAAEGAGSLLHEAAVGGSAKIIAALLDAGFAPGAADRFGWMPLHYAARDGRTEAARILVERGAPIDARNIAGQTAYNVAQERKMDPAARLLAEKGADTSAVRFPALKGDYLGQKPPGETAEIFGLGIVSSVWGLHSSAVFSPDGNEVYWAPMINYPGEIYSSGGLLTMKRVDGVWMPPTWASFSGPDLNDDVPFFSADGRRLYFISSRPLPGIPEDREQIWCVDRTDGGWSKPRTLDPALNDHAMHWAFSLDRKGDLYFAGQAADSSGLDDIYQSRFVDGRYEKPVNLGGPINTKDNESMPFIAPDGSYLLFSRQYDLWVSFRGPGGAWGAPVKLGPEVNTPATELCPVVTADGKYIFFISSRGGENSAYWVSASVIEKARPFPALKGDYLGQMEPGLKPEVFAPGVVSTKKKELNSVFTPDAKEFYFTVQEPPRGWTIMVMKREGDVWTKPRPADFSGTWSDVDHFLTPDGKKMYFCSNRPLDGKGATQNNFDIWMVERKGEGWSEAQNMGAPINSPENEFYPSVAKDGTIVFQSWRTGSKGGRDIYRARLTDGVYKTAESLGPPISTDLAEGDALISPDGDFIILSVERPDGLGAGDLCASFRGKDGSWSEPRNMGGEINTKANENCPIISPDGKFLFYTSAGDIYWVSSKIIDAFRPGRKE